MPKIWAYIAQDSRVPADRLIAELHQRFQLLTKFPELGAKRDHLAPELRAFPHGRYVIYYILQGVTILIVRVVHGSRDAAAIFD